MSTQFIPVQLHCTARSVLSEPTGSSVYFTSQSVLSQSSSVQSSRFLHTPLVIHRRALVWLKAKRMSTNDKQWRIRDSDSWHNWPDDRRRKSTAAMHRLQPQQQQLLLQ